jgi:hypothetical protein
MTDRAQPSRNPGMDLDRCAQCSQVESRNELVRPKRVESVSNQYCDAENYQNAYNSRPHKQSLRRQRVRGREPAQSKRILKIRRELLGSDDFEQQKGRSPTQKISVMYPRPAELRSMARRPITREVVLGAILDIVMGIALTAGTVYVAGLCLAR